MEYRDFFPTYEIDKETGEMTVYIPKMAWNPLIRYSEAFKNRG